MLPIKNGKVGTPYGRRCCRNEGGKTTAHYWSEHVHKGQDYPTPAGTDVLAAADGVVFGIGLWGSAFGKNSVVIKHVVGGVTYYAMYAHLMTALVAKGAKVTKGQHIGESGGRKGHPEDGNVFGEHLHFEVLKSTSWSPTAHVDPTPLLNA
jgi:murein DD-endopeptidase MepM/ murein hydrolase activator NlpD